MRAIHATAYRRTPLVLAGADDLVALARQIHLRTNLGAAPFVLCGERRYESDDSLGATATLPDTGSAFALAMGGTVCVRADNLPSSYDELAARVASPLGEVQLYLCARNDENPSASLPLPILVPELARRPAADRQQIVLEYAMDALSALGAERSAFPSASRAWVEQHEATSFADIEVATLRLVALRHAGTVHQAAARLGLSHVSLGKWYKRRGIVA